MRYADLVPGDVLIDDDNAYVIVEDVSERFLWLNTAEGTLVDTKKTVDQVRLMHQRLLTVPR